MALRRGTGRAAWQPAARPCGRRRPARATSPRCSARPTPQTQIYACGPARMIAALEDHCAAWPEDALRVEHFVSALGTLDPSREQPFTVELKDSGLTVEVPAHQTLLHRAALRQHRRAERLRGRPVRLLRGARAGGPGRPSRRGAHARRTRGEQPDDGLLLARGGRREAGAGVVARHVKAGAPAIRVLPHRLASPGAVTCRAHA